MKNTPVDQKLSSSTTLEVLGALWLKDTLVRIEHKLDLLLRVSVSPEQLAKLGQAGGELKSTTDALAKAIEEQKGN